EAQDGDGELRHQRISSRPAGVVDDGGASEGDPVTVLQTLAGDALAVDERAVGAAEVAHRRVEVRAVGRDPDLRVATGDAGVVEDDVPAVVAADDVDRAHKEEAVVAAGEVGPVARTGAPGRDRPRAVR